MESEKKINNFIDRIVFDYRKKRTVKGLVLGLLTGVLFLLIIQLLRIFLIINISIKTIVFIILLLLLLGGIMGFSLFIKYKQLISKADRILGLEEMMITYYEYSQKEADENYYLPLLKNRLLQAVSKIENRSIFNLKIEKELGLIAIFLISSLFLDIWLDFPANYYSATEAKTKAVISEEYNSGINSYQGVEDEEKNILESDYIHSLNEGLSENYFNQTAAGFELRPGDFPPDDGKTALNDGDLYELIEELLRDAEYSSERSDDYQNSFDENNDDELWDVVNDKNNDNDKNKKKLENRNEEDEKKRGENEFRDKDDFLDSDFNNTPVQEKEEETVLQDIERESSNESSNKQGDVFGNDNFEGVNQEYESSRLNSQNNSNFFNIYIEELLRPDIAGIDSGITGTDLIRYRDFIINSLENEKIPANYKDLVREYFQKIIQ